MSPSKMVMGGSISTTVAIYSEQITPFNIERNMSSAEMMLIGKSAHGNDRISMTQTHMVNSGRTSYTLSNLHGDSVVGVTTKLDAGDTAGIDHAQEGIVDRMNDVNDFSWDDMFCNPPNEVRTSFIGLFLGFACELLIG